MSDISPRLSLPLLQPSQAQKHVTHNEALRVLDILVQLSVEAFDATVPPAVPVEGEVYAVGSGATGAWASAVGQLAVWVDGAWQFHTPMPGWAATLASTAEMRVFDGLVWTVISGGGGTFSPQNLAGVGINTVSDLTNRLSVSSPATLLNHEGAGHQLKINKAAVADTGSLLFQTGFSGRAEIGLTGDDDLSIKLSADGSTWVEALRLAPGDEVYSTANPPPASGGGVIASGSNANGSYTRFSDGTQMCWKNDFVAAGSSGGVWTFPVPFVDADVAVNATPRDSFARFITVTGLTATAATLNNFLQPGGTELPDTHVTAIGRWS